MEGDPEEASLRCAVHRQVEGRPGDRSVDDVDDPPGVLLEDEHLVLIEEGHRRRKGEAAHGDVDPEVRIDERWPLRLAAVRSRSSPSGKASVRKGSPIRRRMARTSELGPVSLMPVIRRPTRSSGPRFADLARFLGPVTRPNNEPPGTHGAGNGCAGLAGQEPLHDRGHLVGAVLGQAVIGVVDDRQV